MVTVCAANSHNKLPTMTPPVVPKTSRLTVTCGSSCWIHSDSQQKGAAYLPVFTGSVYKETNYELTAELNGR